MPPARRNEYGRLETVLSEAGIAMPPLPDGAEARLKERRDACFSTRAFRESPLDLQHFVRKAIAGASPDYVLIARVPQGVGSCVLHYFVVQGPLQIFLQLACGSAAGRDRSATSANECFGLAHELVAAVPRALGAGRLSRSGRLTVVGSDLVESFWEIAATGEHATQPGRPSREKAKNVRKPRQVLEEAVRWCRGGLSLA